MGKNVFAFLGLALIVGAAGIMYYRTQSQGLQERNDKPFVEKPEESASQGATEKPSPAATDPAALLAQRKYEDALKAADAQLAKTEAVDAEALLLLRARALTGMDKQAEAVAAYQQFLEKYPQSAQAGDARLEAIIAQAKTPQAEERWTAVKAFVERDTAHPQYKDVLQDYAQHCLEVNQKAEARLAFSRLLRVETDPARRRDAREQLVKINEALLYSPSETDGSILYEVKSGDNPEKIGAQYAVPGLWICKVNRVEPTKLQIGQKLKITPGPFDVEVDTATFTLTVWAGEVWIRDFSVGIGVDQTTPKGEFIVKEKINNPDYEPAGGDPVAFEQGTPLGTRWIAFTDANGVLKSYGIHGTNEPQSIGTKASKGCIRMLNSDVEQLFDMLVRNKSRVIIK